MEFPVIPEEIASMRRDLRRIRSLELSVILLTSVPLFLSVQELVLKNSAVVIPSVQYWSFVFLALAVVVWQWIRYIAICRRLKQSENVPDVFADDFYQIAVWEPRILLFTLSLFMTAVYFTGMLGAGGEGSLRYTVIPGGAAVTASCLRGYIRARDLTSRILRKYYRRGAGTGTGTGTDTQ